MIMRNRIVLILALIALVFVDLKAQNQIVRREQTDTKITSKKKSDKSKKVTRKAYPYVRSYKRAICYKMSTNYGVWLNSIVLTSEHTTLNREIMPTDSEVYAYSESSQYLLDLDTNIKYYIKKSEIGVGKSHRRYFYESMFKAIPFKEYYEPLPITTRRVRLFDGERFSSEIIYL